MTGDDARAQSLAQDLNKQYPLDTQMQSLWLPAINAQLALNRKNPAAAINDLQSALPPIEYGQIGFLTNLSCLYPTYIRGRGLSGLGERHGRCGRVPEDPRPQRHRLELLDRSAGEAGRSSRQRFAGEDLAGRRCRPRSHERAEQPTRTSSRCGKTPTPIFPSTNKPKPSTRSYSSSLASQSKVRSRR